MGASNFGNSGSNSGSDSSYGTGGSSMGSGVGSSTGSGMDTGTSNVVNTDATSGTYSNTGGMAGSTSGTSTGSMGGTTGNTPGAGYDTEVPMEKAKETMQRGMDNAQDAFAQLQSKANELTSRLIDNIDVDDLTRRLEEQVRDHPTRTLLVAVGAGFLLGRAAKR